MKNDKKKQWIIGIIIGIVILIMANQTNKKTEQIGINVHYYLNGQEVFPENNLFSFVSPPTPGIYCDTISVDIVGTNTGNTPLNLTIINASPTEFKNKLPTNMVVLNKGITNKVIWRSGNITTYPDLERYGQPFNLLINVSGAYTTGSNILKTYSATSKPISVLYEQMVSFRTSDLTYPNPSQGEHHAIAFTSVCGKTLIKLDVGAKTCTSSISNDCPSFIGGNIIGNFTLPGNPRGVNPKACLYLNSTNGNDYVILWKVSAVSNELNCAQNAWGGYHYIRNDASTLISDVRHTLNPTMEITCSR